MRDHDEVSGRGRVRSVGLRRLRSWLAGLLLLASSSAWAAPPDEEQAPPVVEEGPEPEPEPSTAGGWYARGIELGNAGDFAGAAAAFLRSYELQPTPEALFNAGLALENHGDAIAAIETYRRFLAEPEQSEQLAAAAQRSIDALTRQVGVLKGVRYEPEHPPKELHVAGERRELDELPLLLPPGPVVIEVVDQRGERARETYELDAGEALVVDLRALLRPPEPEPPPELVVDDGPTPAELAALERRSQRARRLRTTTWIGLGLTGASAVALATVGALTIRERRAFLDDTCYEYEGGICPPGFEPGDPEAHFDAYQRYRLGTAITTGLTAGFAVGTVIVGLISLRLDKPARASTKARVRPAFGGLLVNF